MQASTHCVTENNLKNEDEPKNNDDLKNEDDLKSWSSPPNFFAPLPLRNYLKFFDDFSP